MFLSKIKTAALKFTATLVLFFFFTTPFQKAFTQLSASFSISRESGCRPLTVKFVNTTTGAGQDVAYSWNFGNGNTSTLKDPGATFIEEKTYTVTLTVTSGGSTSTATRQVTVHKTPTVDFLATPTSGCMPLEVSFQANVTPGDGTIDRYFWDFGDGKTEEAPTLSAPKHTYTQAQQAPVSLTVTNSFGCFNTKSSPGFIQVHPLPEADFTWAKNPLCGNNEPIPFQNKSLVQSGTTWLWDFGDGNKSTQKDPVHKYASEGTFKVSLVAKSNQGCTDSIHYFISNAIEMILPSVVCEGDTIELKHNVPRPFLFENWYVNGVRIAADFQGKHYYKVDKPDGLQVRLDIETNNCTASKEATIAVNPVVTKSHIQKIRLNPCELTPEYEISEQSGFGASWIWSKDNLINVIGNEKSVKVGFDITHEIGYFQLRSVTDKGCRSEIWDTVMFAAPSVRYRISFSNNQWNPNSNNLCISEPVNFRVQTDSWLYPNDIVEFFWDFGDGNTSTEENPKHFYKQPGEYEVTLQYKTAQGCTGSLKAHRKVPIIGIPKATLELEGGGPICGNNPVLLTLKSDSFIDFKYLEIFPPAAYEFVSEPWYDRNTQFQVKFYNSGTFSGLVKYGAGGCYDTLYLDDFFKVNPPFLYKIEGFNTCNGDRLTYRFTDSSKDATKWIWDFGDGTIKEFTTKQDTVYHTYEKSGWYDAKLTVYNSLCSVSDSLNFPVSEKPNNLNLKDYEWDSDCYNLAIPVEISGYEDRPNLITRGMPYEVIGVQYKDFSFDDYFAWLGNAIVWLNAGKDGFRLILQDVNQCVDTTNFVDMKLTGPIIKVDGLQPSYCINDIISIKDVSEAPFGTKIAERSWQLGFQNEPTYSEIGDQREFVRKLTEAGRAYISIVAKDEDGCESGDVFTFEVVGPKSRFKASAEIVAIGTEVNFVNLSDYSNVANAIPTWMMPDGTISNRVNESYTFNEEGEFFVKLFHQTPGSACRDTMVVRILVRSVNAQFTHSIAYLNNNGCPPALVTFTSTASNAVRYGWNFGNGATAGNQTHVSHTYNQPGVYTVWHYTWDENNNVDSTFDIIEIEGPYALISANRMFSCNDLEVTLNADVKNATSFTWDFGDGTLSSTAATTLNHRYLTAGIYTPSLVLEDDEGCQATSQLAQPLIVDSLRADFSYLPTGICAGGQVQFASASRSFSNTRLGTPMQYQWSINGNNLTPGSDSTLAHAFAGEGSYTVRLQVQTDYGCSASATKTLTVQPPLQAAAAGPTSLCIGDSATFTASSVGANVQYRWYLPGRNMITGNTTPRLAMLQTGNFTGWLAASNSACTDSVSFAYTVHGLPQVTIAPSTPRICLGDTLALTVNANATLQWNASSTLQPTTNGARVWPTADTRYRVQAVSQQGCTHADSVMVRVVQPFSVQVSPDVHICTGASATLTASGATAYQWSPAAGLSQPNSANTIATPTATTRYTLTGSDAFGCFTDTASVLVTVNPLPQIDNITDKEVNGGESIEVLANANLPNLQWTWTPATYLSCSNCPNPTIRPLNDVVYTVTATSAAGCKASVSFEVKVLCSKERIYIPNAFTPNGDGLNDRFTLLGGGVTTVRYLRIIDRWGKTIFERKMVPFGSIEASWDGNYPNGSAAPGGNYQFMAELECGSGETFRFDGGVRLLR